LIDTFDTIAAAKHLAAKLQQHEIELAGVRLDSGDLAALSQQVRQLLPDVPIFASGDLDEYKMTQLRAAGACIDGYGLGTQLVTGTPVNGVYKLVEIDGIPVMKEATGKVSYPGRKQIFRSYEQGQAVGDRLGLMVEQRSAVSSQQSADHAPEALTGEQPLMQLVMKQGQRLHPTETLETIAQRTAHSVASLPATVRQLDEPVSLPVEPSTALLDLIAQTQRQRHP
jgi:nicotinate phosphoribosyltransferase